MNPASREALAAAETYGQRFECEFKHYPESDGGRVLEVGSGASFVSQPVAGGFQQRMVRSLGDFRNMSTDSGIEVGSRPRRSLRNQIWAILVLPG